MARQKNVLDQYLHAHGLNRNKVSKATGINPNTLQRASDMTAATDINGRVIEAVAQAAGKTPGTVLDSLIRIQGGSKNV